MVKINLLHEVDAYNYYRRILFNPKSADGDGRYCSIFLELSDAAPSSLPIIVQFRFFLLNYRDPSKHSFDLVRKNLFFVGLT
jgi:hypothetical protein